MPNGTRKRRHYTPEERPHASAASNSAFLALTAASIVASLVSNVATGS